ncbi:MAG: serine/threonine-protein kinase [Polyangiaceae bacterium]
MSACLEEELALDLMSGRLDGAALAAVDEHLDDCALCRELVLTLARLDTRTTAHAAGEELGRYRLLEELGRGAFGVVWRAHDLRLDRDVALKLLRGSNVLPEHLEEEARAMARLAHPHVATVFDVGRLDSGEAFLAMELLEGDTLRQWLAKAPPATEVLARLSEVARGLEAAHRAGLVHRDLKPENILFDSAGHAKITDFGLALGALPPSDDAPIDLSHSMVLPGKLIGTPGYMAPEQLRGETVAAASDQFALCVVLFEALAGAKPFPATTLDELRERLKSPPDSMPANVAPHVESALRRGLAIDPAERFASLSELLSALESPPERTSRVYLAVALVAACAVVAWLVMSWYFGSPQDRGVRAVASEVAEPEGVVKFREELIAFDAPSNAWTPARLQAASELVTRSKELERGALVAQSQELLARGQWELGRFKRAEQSGMSALGAAQRAGDQRLEATAWLTLAGIASSAGRLKEAEQRCDHAKNLLSSIADPLLEASLNNTLGVVLTAAGRYPEARAALDAAIRVRKKKLGERDVAVARVLTNLGNLARAQGDYKQALELHEQAQSIDEAKLGRQHPGIARHLHNRARASLLMGQPARAQALYEQALGIERKAFGEQHPAVTRTLNSLGLLYAATERPERAEKYYREAIDSGQGFEGLEGALARYNLGLLLLRRDQPQPALAELEAAAVVVEKILGTSHRQAVLIQLAQGQALLAQGQRDSGEFVLRRALKLALALEVPDAALQKDLEGALTSTPEKPAVPRVAPRKAASALSAQPAPPSAPAVSAAGSYMPGPAFQ